MTTYDTVDDIRRGLAPHRGRASIALVPTMGALHDGHVALFRAARRACGVVVASIFVNPAQFNDAADLAAYPRDTERDARIAEAEGVHYVFIPSPEQMYPYGYATWIEPAGAALGLEGAWRAGHFRGVATVCVKLFTIVQPQVAFFGQKDAQQVAVIKQTVRDLNLPMEIGVLPTIREPDGLALSSRNARLSPDERQRALAVPRALRAGLAGFKAGVDPVAAARPELRDVDVEYITVARLDGRDTLLVAARIGATRLIDNVVLDLNSEPPL